MGKELAKAYVTLGWADKGFHRGLKDVEKGVKGLKPLFEGVEKLAKSFLAGSIGMGALATKAFMDEQEGLTKLRSALASTGQEVDGNASRLDAFARRMQDLTVYSHDAIEAQMQFATNMGVTAAQMETVTKRGIGLAQAFFGGDLEKGMEASAKAQEGNVRALKQMIPALKNVADPTRALAMITARARAGFIEAQTASGTLKGQLTQLKNGAMDAAAGFGEAMAPQIQKATAWLKIAANALKNMSPELKAQVVHWAAMAAAIAAAVVIGPSIIGFAGGVAASLSALSTVVMGLGQAMLFVVASPIGALLGGLALLATGFAYLSGSGSTMSQNIVSGFMDVIGFMDHVLGSWKGFTASILTLWHQIGYYSDSLWLGVKSVAIETWEYLKSEFPNLVYGWGAALAEFGVKAFGIMRNIAEGIRKIWEDVVNYVANLMAEGIVKDQATKAVMEKYDGQTITKKMAHEMALTEINPKMNALRSTVSQEGVDKGLKGKELADYITDQTAQRSKGFIQDANSRYEKQFGGRKLSEAELQAQIDKETRTRLDALNQQKTAAQKQAEAEHAERLKGIADSTKAQVDGVKKWSSEGLAKTPAEHAREREAAEADLAKQRSDLEASHAKQLADDLSKIFDAPKLSDKAKAAWDAIKTAIVPDGMIDKIKDLAAKHPEDAKIDDIKGGSGAPAKIAFKSIDEVLRQNIAARIVGVRTLAQQQAKKDRDRQKALKLQEDANKLLQRILHKPIYGVFS